MAIRGMVDFGQQSAQELERSMESLQPGWYRATVSDMVADEHQNLKVHFDLDGRNLTETLWNPEGGKDTNAMKRLAQRRGLFAIRLGLVPRDAKGQVCEFDWEDAIGRECVLELEWSKPNADGKKFANVKWAGIYTTDDPRAIAGLKGEKAPPKKAAAAAATSPTQATSAAQPVNRISGAISRPAAAGINLYDL